jgi:hypothetical protein
MLVGSATFSGGNAVIVVIGEMAFVCVRSAKKFLAATNSLFAIVRSALGIGRDAILLSLAQRDSNALYDFPQMRYHVALEVGKAMVILVQGAPRALPGCDRFFLLDVEQCHDGLGRRGIDLSVTGRGGHPSALDRMPSLCKLR